MAAPIRIAIADDHALFRQGLRSMLRLQPEVAVVAEVERAGEIMPAIERTPCDVLLLDLQMDRSSLSDVAALAERVKVIVVTATERVEDALGAIHAGARGVVFKRFAIETLMMAIRAVMDGHVWMPPALQAEVTAHLRNPHAVVLTRREREIVRHVALGLRNAEVARRLGITEVTVKTHLNNVFQKLGLRDRVELALYAVRTGIVGIHERRF
jgi:two-component system nitrate/nitrite response regulator NarL